MLRGINTTRTNAMLLRTFLLLSVAFAFSCHGSRDTAPAIRTERPKISFTFDDGLTTDMPGYPFRTWNALILGHLEKEQVKAVFFVTGNNKTDEAGRYLLQSWNDAGQAIGNHTFSHPNYNSDKTSYEVFRQEFLKTDTIIRAYRNYVKLFRFPYLKEGNTAEKIEQFRRLMQENGYRNGYVTIDASDWAIDSRLRKKLKAQPDAPLEPFRQFYLEHLYERAQYYENLAQQLTGRHIPHTLLLHHNLTSALFLGDLIALFREKGWDIVPATAAFDDPVYREQPGNVPAGESLIWALAKQSGRFEAVLRYPAEDERYEREKMDRLGL